MVEHTAILMVVDTVTRTVDTATLMAVMATHTIKDTLTVILTITAILMDTLMATLMVNTRLVPSIMNMIPCAR